MKKICVSLLFIALFFAMSMSVNALTFGEWEYQINSDNTVTLTKYIGYDIDVEIPATIAGLPVTKLEGTFRNYKSLKSITIPYGIAEIGNYAFYYCSNLTNVTIPDSVTTIGYSAFCGCYNLTSVIIPDSVISIGEVAFYGCNFISITIPSSVTSIGDHSFWRCDNLTSVIIPDSIISIGKSAFSSCPKLTEITIPHSVTSIGDDAFSYCTKLSTAYFNHLDASTITSFGQNVFYNTAPNFKIYYPANATDFTTPKWKGYPAYPTDYIAPTGVSLNTNAETLHTGDTVTLEATVTPDNATNKSVTWSSSNLSVATVDDDGMVTAVSAGTATITAKTVDGNRTATCTITVEMTTTDINGIKITIQPRTTAGTLLEAFGATKIESKDGTTLNPADFVGTGAVITFPNGNRFTVVVHGDLTGKGAPQIEDAKVYLESLVGNKPLDEAQALALEDIVKGNDSALKKLRAFLTFIR